MEDPLEAEVGALELEEDWLDETCCDEEDEADGFDDDCWLELLAPELLAPRRGISESSIASGRRLAVDESASGCLPVDLEEPGCLNLSKVAESTPLLVLLALDCLLEACCPFGKLFLVAEVRPPS